MWFCYKNFCFYALYCITTRYFFQEKLASFIKKDLKLILLTKIKDNNLKNKKLVAFIYVFWYNLKKRF